MKILVTVGTTAFDSLIERVDKGDFDIWDCVLQIGPGMYVPDNKFSRYYDNIDDLYKSSDIVITHAGAGSVYRLLELGVRTVVVPNLERCDSHQKDLACYVEKNKYAVVCWSLDSLADCVLKANSSCFNKYTKVPFFKAGEISSYIKGVIS